MVAPAPQAPLAAAVAERVTEELGAAELAEVLDWIDLGGAGAAGDSTGLSGPGQF